MKLESTGNLVLAQAECVRLDDKVNLFLRNIPKDDMSSSLILLLNDREKLEFIFHATKVDAIIQCHFVSLHT